MTNTFELTPDLITLLRSSYVSRRISDVETGAAEIDGKRPYGNSDVAADVCELLGLIGDPYEDSALEDRAMAIHEQTPTALQIVLCTGQFEPGTYAREVEYDATSWKRIA